MTPRPGLRAPGLRSSASGRAIDPVPPGTVPDYVRPLTDDRSGELRPPAVGGHGIDTVPVETVQNHVRRHALADWSDASPHP